MGFSECDQASVICKHAFVRLLIQQLPLEHAVSEGLFFISHTDEDLAAMVNKGRKEEFSSFNWQGEPPDPRLEQTFTDSMLQWQLLNKEPHKSMFAYYRSLIAFRKAHPALNNTNRNATIAEASETTRILRLQRWSDNQRLECILNFSNADQRYEWPSGKVVFSSSATQKKNEISAESILIFETP
jgi:maltooligosyltrehalose trehalohydrolase